MDKISFFYKMAILLAIGVCSIAIAQSYQLRKELKSVRDEMTVATQAHGTLMKTEVIQAYEDGYKQSVLDNKLKKNRYILTQDKSQIKVWRLDGAITLQEPKIKVDTNTTKTKGKEKDNQ